MARVQIYSPHPDDVELFVGGTLLKHIEEGDQVQIVMMTRGGKGSLISAMHGDKLIQMRNQETDLRMQLIPTVAIEWLEFLDGEMEVTSAGTEKVLKSIEAWQPEIIYLPEVEYRSSYRNHSDHVATANLVVNAAKKFEKKLQLRCYHTRNYNLLVDITSHYKENGKALKCFKSQYLWSANWPFILYGLTITRAMRTRWWGMKNRCKFAEAFRSFYVEGKELEVVER